MACLLLYIYVHHLREYYASYITLTFIHWKKTKNYEVIHFKHVKNIKRTIGLIKIHVIFQFHHVNHVINCYGMNYYSIRRLARLCHKFNINTLLTFLYLIQYQNQCTILKIFKAIRFKNHQIIFNPNHLVLTLNNNVNMNEAIYKAIHKKCKLVSFIIFYLTSVCSKFSSVYISKTITAYLLSTIKI